MPKNTTPALLTIGEAARYLGVSVDTMRRWDRDDRLKAVRISSSSHRRYRLTDLQDALRGGSES